MYSLHQINTEVQSLMFTCCLPGGLQVVADLIHLEQDMYGMQNDPIDMALRRYAGMALTNLTFGDVVNKVQTGQAGAVVVLSVPYRDQDR